jgi:hypothetical protein
MLVPTTAFRRTRKVIPMSPMCRKAATLARDDFKDSSISNGDHDAIHKNDDMVDEEDIEFLFEEPEIPYKKIDGMEKTWRHAKKPLLSIGSKGATHSHGNSLRQLLEDHTVVKVKVNTRKFGR